MTQYHNVISDTGLPRGDSITNVVYLRIQHLSQPVRIPQLGYFSTPSRVRHLKCADDISRASGQPTPMLGDPIVLQEEGHGFGSKQHVSATSNFSAPGRLSSGVSCWQQTRKNSPAMLQVAQYDGGNVRCGPMDPETGLPS
jgi:hypothetical protein